MKTISRIAYSNDKKNKTRSILIMMSICLTTMLLVIISTVGNGMIRLQKSQAAGSYGSNYGLFIAADGTQLKEVERRAEISDIGIMCTEGILKGNENGGFVSADETVRKMLPYNQEYVLKEGTYPEKAQEIAAGRTFFDAVGYHDVKVGDIVTLEYRSGMQSEYAPVEFTVSGILYDRDEYTIEASYVVFGSQDFYNERVAEGDRQYNIYFTLSDSANVSMNNVAPVIKEIADSCGIDQKNVIINDLYLQWVLQPSYEMIVVCGTLILGIVLFSVVVIYNIFQVGIAGGMTEAIADATGGESDLSFTHVGIITVEPDGIYVLEAKSEPGVTMTPLQKFLDSSATIEGRPAAAIARITLPERRELATRAIGEAKKYLGQPYDDSFLPHNGKMYCSELVWECYLTGPKSEHLFTARPMNFRTADGRLPQFWIDHFAAMDEPIPEGVPGTNPQDMSREKFLKIVYRYWQ